MTSLPRAILFDIGDTLVRAAAPGTPVGELRAAPIGTVVADLAALAAHVRLGAVTDTSVMTEADVRAALGGTGLSELLEVVVTSCDVGVAKPDPRGLLAALGRLGVEPAEALFVGDSPVDRGAAEAAGVAFVETDPAGGAGAAVREHLAAAHGAFAAARWFVGLGDADLEAVARQRHDGLAKPPGSLGRIEDLGVRLAAIAAACPPPPPSPAAVAVFAGDHGVVAEGVTAWPQEITAQMVEALAGGGAAVQVLARATKADVLVVDVGVASEVTARPGLRVANVRRGTRNLAEEPALTPAEVAAALDVGAQVATDLVAGGARALVTGDMGIGNTTPSAAVISALTGRDAADVVGRGAGADDATMERKLTAIRAGLARLEETPTADQVLSEVGGLEITALAGFIVGGASHRVPVVIDGVIALAGLVAAASLCPNVVDFVVAGHRSTEPGATAALDHLRLAPLLDLGLRLGEGTGAVLALPLLDAAAAVLTDMASLTDLA